MNIRATYPLFLLAACAYLPGSARSEPLGRLFFTPAERLQIDQQLQAAPQAAPPRLDGIITRSHGTATLFLDGRAVPADTHQIRQQDASARIRSPDGRIHRVQVGPPSVTPHP